ncbi:hypothetical protein ESZ50_00695 [Weissella muntiaci]|uniref:DNA-directed RNA polymerase beta subunit n=1 Tax=Weissella muntiaci TaxID=2508881 RepID=A0A6C2CCY2_9LACO|nr:hypothetical protein [Weissella muntiaci]TYC51085.1 hypothetical protein ESZ50_00695 [Weissella muntiaci]
MEEMLLDDEEYLQRAKFYFEHDYKDRGMVKWNGYYLSDHTQDVAEYSADRSKEMNQKAMPEMPLEDISRILFEAYSKNLQVQIQERSQAVNGIVPPIIIGFVKGFDEENVYIGDRKIGLDSLLWSDYFQK